MSFLSQALSNERWARTEVIRYGQRLYGKNSLIKVLPTYDPLFLVKSGDVAQLKKVKYYLDCGDNDYFTFGNSELHILMTQRHIPHEFILCPGKHSWEYWYSGLSGVLKFIGKVFTR